MGRQVDLYRQLHYLVFNDYRRQQRIVSTEEFREAWNLANDNQKEEFYRLIDKPDSDVLRKLMTDILIGSESDCRTFESLRRLASIKGVPYYSRMTKAELISELTKD